jgi:hypothetical protein
VVIGFAVVPLSMYVAVLQRIREIGTITWMKVPDIRPMSRGAPGDDVSSWDHSSRSGRRWTNTCQRFSRA